MSINSQKFNPPLYSIFYHPFFFIRKEIYRFVKENSNLFSGELLDFGGGSKPYQHLFPQIRNYYSIEVESDKEEINADLIYDGKNLPFEDNKFDTIICTEVFEHIEDLSFTLKELKRVLKPEGKILITTPFMCIEHEMPNDYRRLSLNGLISLMKKNDFELKKKKKFLNNILTITQLINFYLYTLLMNKKRKIINYLLYFLLMGPINVIGFLINLVLPKIDEMYFGTGTIFEKKN